MKKAAAMLLAAMLVFSCLAPSTVQATEAQSNTYCPHCEQEVQWSVWDGTVTSGHFYLAEDYTTLAEVKVGTKTDADVDIVLDLNGYTWTTTGARAFSVYGVLTILDSATGGVIRSAGTADAHGGVVFANGGGTLNLYSGTLTLLEDHKTIDRGGILYIYKSNLNMYGGRIINGDCVGYGGNVCASGSTVNILGGELINGHCDGKQSTASDAKFGNGGGNLCAYTDSTVTLENVIITGGSSGNHGGNVFMGSGTWNVKADTVITGGTADKKADGIYVGSSTTTLNITGGALEGVEMTGAAAITLSGAPKMSITTAGNLLTLGELTRGADIAVNADGVFTAQNENAAAYAGYFKTAVEGMGVVVVDNALSMTPKPKEVRFRITADKASADRGEEVTFTVTAAGYTKCTHYGLVLTYDADVFEVVSGTCTAPNALVSNFRSDRGFAVLYEAAEIPSSEVGTFTLRVKDGAAYGTSAVSCDVSVMNDLDTVVGSVNSVDMTLSPRKYTVEFLDWDGIVLSSALYFKGDAVTVPAEPVRAADNTYTYAFAGWDKEIVACAGDTAYTATYEASYIDYAVTFQYEDGTVISTATYHYGDTVTVPADPENGELEFSGWDREITVCQGNAVYTAVFAPEYPFGDYNKDLQVTNEDVVYLLWHTLFADDYPIETKGDFTGDGLVTNEDVVYLLWHTLFPEDYPLA